jgi:hypothetical protein
VLTQCVARYVRYASFVGYSTSGVGEVDARPRIFDQYKSGNLRILSTELSRRI